MNTEYEVKILDVDHDSIVAKLESLGAQKSDGCPSKTICL